MNDLNFQECDRTFVLVNLLGKVIDPPEEFEPFVSRERDSMRGDIPKETNEGHGEIEMKTRLCRVPRYTKRIDDGHAGVTVEVVTVRALYKRATGIMEAKNTNVVFVFEG